MGLLSEQDQATLRNEFAALQTPVKLIVFSQETECQYCRETRQIAEELSALADNIELEVFDFVADSEVAAQFNIDKIPATVVMRGGGEPLDYGIRYYGVPSGYEFSSLVHDILRITSGDSGLAEETRGFLADLTTPVHLQVFVTPTCPYCPQAVLLAHQMAMESPLVTADMVEATEFPHLSMKYQVMGVPRTVVNETVYLEGAAPEAMLLQKLTEALA